MNNVIFTFTKPVPNGTVVSGRIAEYVADTLRLPLYHDYQIRGKWDILFIVNGAFAFCSALPDLAVAVRRARHVVWIQNDYTISPPSIVGNAQSPFRLAFRQREMKGMSRTYYWTTVWPNAKNGKIDRYINWNCLGYPRHPVRPHTLTNANLYYYGAFRQQRVAAFDRYFARPAVPTTISSTSKKFAARYRRVVVSSGLPHDTLITVLNRQGLGLYIEDERSHHEFHSPATRFYEMLAAGLPMVFQPEAVRLLRKAGIRGVENYVVPTAKSVRHFLPQRDAIVAAQRDAWHEPYQRELDRDVRDGYAAFVRYAERH